MNRVRDSITRDTNMLAICKVLSQAEPADAIGASVAILLQMCAEKPHIIGPVLNQLVYRAGYDTQSVLDIFNRVCGKG